MLHHRLRCTAAVVLSTMALRKSKWTVVYSRGMNYQGPEREFCHRAMLTSRTRNRAWCFAKARAIMVPHDSWIGNAPRRNDLTMVTLTITRSIVIILMMFGHMFQSFAWMKSHVEKLRSEAESLHPYSIWACHWEDLKCLSYMENGEADLSRQRPINNTSTMIFITSTFHSTCDAETLAGTNRAQLTEYSSSYSRTCTGYDKICNICTWMYYVPFSAKEYFGSIWQSTYLFA